MRYRNDFIYTVLCVKNGEERRGEERAGEIYDLYLYIVYCKGNKQTNKQTNKQASKQGFHLISTPVK